MINIYAQLDMNDEVVRDVPAPEVRRTSMT